MVWHRPLRSPEDKTIEEPSKGCKLPGAVSVHQAGKQNSTAKLEPLNKGYCRMTRLMIALLGVQDLGEGGGERAGVGVNAGVGEGEEENDGSSFTAESR